MESKKLVQLFLEFLAVLYTLQLAWGSLLPVEEDYVMPCAGIHLQVNRYEKIIYVDWTQRWYEPTKGCSEITKTNLNPMAPSNIGKSPGR